MGLKFTDEEIENIYKFVDILTDAVCDNALGEDFKNAKASSDKTQLLKRIARYFRNRPDCKIEAFRGKTEYDIEEANRATEGIMTVVNIEHRFPNGRVDFLYNPTEENGPVNHEWLWQLNRHYFWQDMAIAYLNTNDKKYPKAFERQVIDWTQNVKLVEHWNWSGSGWRTIECGIRLLGSWQCAFEIFRHSEDVSDEAIVSMLATMYQQAVHLMQHPTGQNWLLMECTGAYTFAAMFPEFKEAYDIRKFACDKMTKELEAQILPDGFQYELSPDYHSVVFWCYTSFFDVAKSYGLENELPSKFYEIMKIATEAMINVSTPAFTQPRTNDCFTIDTKGFAIKNVFPDWDVLDFVLSDRKEGSAPSGETASRFMPYAGFCAMRNDWSADSTYMCFDVGPLGMAHFHQDKLNINVFKGNEELLYDDGGGQYEVSDERKYAVSGYSHNTGLVDDLAQSRKEPKKATEAIDAGWVSNDEFDYAYGIYDDEYGEGKPATHKREVRFCKPDFFVVRDEFASADGNKHDYDILFQLNTTKTKTIDNCVVSEYGKKYDIVIMVLNGEAISSVSAQREPRLGGWYFGRNDENLHPSTTVSVGVKKCDNHTFTTLLFPIKSGDDMPVVESIGNGEYNVKFNGKSVKINVNSLNK